MTHQTAQQINSADQLRRDATIDAAVQAIVERHQQATAHWTGAQPPDPDRATVQAARLEQFADLKGRGAIYPLLGSGLGKGALVEGVDGSIKWDMISGIGVHGFGHSDPDLMAVALHAAMSDTVMQGNLQYNDDAIAFADTLMSEASKESNLRHCFLTNSGAMANESALKICYQNKESRAQRILAFEGCFLGRSTKLAQIGDNPAGRVGIPLSAHVDYVPFYHPARGEASTQGAIDELRGYLDRYPGQHACFTMELIQGEGGFNHATPDFFIRLMECCHEADVPVWVDEVQTFGRTERMFHFQQLGIGEYIDVVTVGKMSQVCACLYTGALNPQPGLLSGTFIGSTIGLNVGRRILERLRDGDYYGSAGRNHQLHQAFRERARRLVDAHPDWFPSINGDRLHYGGCGGMMRLTPFGGAKQPILDLLHTMFADGVIAFYCGHGPYHLRFLPPVGVMEADDLDAVFAILESSMATVTAAG